MKGIIRIKFGKPQLTASELELKKNYTQNYSVNYIINKDKQEDVKITEEKKIIIKITTPLEKYWQESFTDPSTDLEKVLFEHGKRLIIEKLKEGILNDPEICVLSLNTQHPKCPYDPKNIEEPNGAEIEFELPGKK